MFNPPGGAGPSVETQRLNAKLLRAYLGLGAALRESGEFEKAERTLREAVELDPGRPDTYLALALVYKDWGRSAEAEKALHRAIELGPDQADAHRTLGGMLSEDGRYEEAVGVLQRAAELEPNDYSTWLLLGLVHEKLQRPAEAVQTYLRVIPMASGWLRGSDHVRRSFAKLVELAGADEAEELAMGVLPAEPDTYGTLASLFCELGIQDKAEKLLLRAIETEPGEARWTIAHGEVLYHLARYEDAANEYRRAAELQPDSTEAHNNLGAALVELGRFAEAEGAYRRAIELEPESALCRRNLADVLGRLRRFSEAYATMEEAARMDSTHPKAHHILGWLYFLEGRVDEAINETRKGIELDKAPPRHLDMRYDYALYHLVLHGLDAALPYYGQAMDADSGLSLLNRAIQDIGDAEELYPDFTEADKAIDVLQTRAAEMAFSQTDSDEQEGWR